jgi:hypothetical protein
MTNETYDENFRDWLKLNISTMRREFCEMNEDEFKKYCREVFENE